MKIQFKSLWTPGILIGVALIGVLMAGCGDGEKVERQYHCPMHPTYITDRPGDCPICGMRVVPIETKTEPTVTPKYACPMHPEVTSDKPDQRCPKCGMKLEPIEDAAPTTTPTESVGTPPAGHETHASPAKYACPMHPEVTSDRPDQRCPKCGMFLEPVPSESAQPATDTPIPHETGSPGGAHEGHETPDTTSLPGSSSSAAPSSGERKILYYRNPMDPGITSPVPAKDSMGMDFIPVYADEASMQPSHVAGLAPVVLNPEGERMAGIQVVEATTTRVQFTTRTVGTVSADETRIRHIHTKIAGYVERLYSNFTGQAVREGEPILTIYSPELLASQEEYLRAMQIAERFKKSSIPEVRNGGEDLVNSARRRLELFDVPHEFIETLIRTRKPQRTVTLNAPVSGFVTAKDVFEGQQIEPGMELFTVTDLSRVWIEADFYEYEAPSIRLNQVAELTFPYDPDLVLHGRVSYVYPFLNPESRTLKVRFDFENPNYVLKPAMYVDVSLRIDAGEGIVVPDSAVMDTGVRQVVFVEQSPGRIDPREVKVGVRNSGQAQILAGVKAGEKVVIRANFLIDSESRLRAAIGGLTSTATP